MEQDRASAVLFHIEELAGQPLIDTETEIDLIGPATAKKGLKVKCILDDNDYPTGIKAEDEEYDRADAERNDPMPDWNYIIRGFPSEKNLTKLSC